jgi:putative tricarboxylic transport membrane protein
MLAFGALGFLMKKTDLPTTPLLLGFILGPIIEVNLRRGLMKSQGDFTPFVTEPISGVILLLTLAVVAFVAVKAIRRKPRLDSSANTADDASLATGK